MQPVHATSVVFCGRGLLIRGASGVGKSDLAIRIMDAGGSLVSDDRTDIAVKDGVLIASAPEAIRGMIELRGVGLLRVPFIKAVRLDAVIECVEGEIERLPEPAFERFHDVSLPVYRIRPREASAVAKIRAILQNPLVS